MEAQGPFQPNCTPPEAVTASGARFLAYTIEVSKSGN
jgi:hypothetical protein